MQNQPDTLSVVIKTAREKADITIEALAEKALRSDTYIGSRTRAKNPAIKSSIS